MVEKLTVDTLANFDGLERLMVIGVGLDVAIETQAAEDVLEQRSRLYRALTRAHMLAVVVNESIACARAAAPSGRGSGREAPRRGREGRGSATAARRGAARAARRGAPPRLW